jgi:hypothetical protein
LSVITVKVKQPNKASYQSGSLLQISLSTQTQKSVQAFKTGPQGPRGPKGDSWAGFNYIQNLPLVTWAIAHNLGYKPSVSTFSAGGVVMLGSVTHLSDNVVQIDFNTPVSGSAHLS